ncbi:hypothetical protein [Candidatus Methanomassiliicoccus intestinalis]|uniref:hypothetical protein n=1 Tax=Candidatus Methanomassiliicoccus intestinalis TaxID=1406512 RepID=UPI0037DDD95D
MIVSDFINALKMQAIPDGYFSERLVAAVKFSDESTKTTFFNADTSVDLAHAEMYRETLKRFSACVICYALSQVREYDFYKCVSVQKTHIDEWFDAHGTEVGQAFLQDYVESILGAPLDGSDDFLGRLADEISEPSFIQNFFIESAVSNTLGGKALLILLKKLDRNGNYFNKVLNAWKQHELFEKMFSDYESYSWLANSKSHFYNGSDIFSKIHDAVKSACCSRIDIIRREREVVEIGPTGAPIIGNVDYDYAIFGNSVVSWIANVAEPYSLSSNIKPNNEMKVGKHRKEPGCVLAGTKILMQDGSSKPIEAIRKNDRVLSVGGMPAIVSDELIINPHVKEFYAINDDEPFLSLEHAILTQQGWKCLNPELAQQINPNLEISLLEVGDVVCKLKGRDPKTGELIYENVMVKKINTHIKECVMSYDLHFTDGYKSYHANDYCCLLNYPEITSSSVSKKIYSLFNQYDRDEVDMLKIKLDDMGPALEQMFGKNSVDYVRSKLENPYIEVEKAQNKYLTSDLLQKNFIFDQIIFPDGKNIFTRLHIIQGNVLVHDKSCSEYAEITVPVTDSEGLYFEHEHYKIYLKFLFDGLMARGIIHDGKNFRTFFALGKSTFSVKLFVENRWLDFANLKIWFEKTRNNSYVPAADLYMTVDGNEESIGERCIFQSILINKKPVLNVKIYINSDIAQFCRDEGLFCADDLNINFSYDYKTLYGNGHIRTTEEESDIKYDLQGEFLQYKLLDEEEAQLQSYLFTKKPLAYQLHLGTTVTTEHNIAHLRSNLVLSVEDLFCIAPPEKMEAVHDYNFSKIKNMMLYFIPPDWRDMMCTLRPSVGKYGDLTNEEVEMINKDPAMKSYLVDNFGKGFITTALYRSTEPSIHNKFDQTTTPTKLDYYWKGIDNEKCFSKNKYYNQISNTVYLDNYMHFVSDLKKYKDDNATKWARELYEYILSPQILQMLAIETISSGKDKLRHIVTMLDILDNRQNVEIDQDGKKTKTSYANSIYVKVLAYNLTFCSTKIQKLPEGSSVDDIRQFVEEIFRNYYQALVEGKPFLNQNLSEEIRQRLKNDLNEYMKDVQKQSIEAFIASIATFLDDLSNFINDCTGLNFQRLRNFSSRHPTICGLLSIAVISTLVISMAAAIYYLVSNRDKLDIVYLLETIVGATTGLVTAFSTFAVFKAGKAIFDLNSSSGEVFRAMRQLNNAMSDVDIIAIGAKEAGGTENYIVRLGNQLGRELVAEERGFVKIAARWAKIVKFASMAAKVVSVLAMGAALGFSIYQTVLDFNNNQPTSIKVLEIIDVVATGLGFLVEIGTGIAGLLGSAIVSSALSVAGMVLMAIGIIVVLVLAFIPRKQEPTPAENFVDNHALKFIDSLPMPSETWVKMKKNQENYLNGGKMNGNKCISI